MNPLQARIREESGTRVLPEIRGSQYGLTFDLIRRAECPHSVVAMINEFLDNQDTSHPFQFPLWGGSGSLLALLRRGNQLSWFAQCGVFYPASRLLRPIRAMAVNRGPACDDLELLKIGLQMLAQEAAKRNFAYIDIIPEWTGAFGNSAMKALRENAWNPVPARRTSLRLDLCPTADSLLAGFRKTTRYEIRRSERGGVEVAAAKTEEQYRDFLRLHADMAEEKNFAADEPDFLTGIFRNIAADPDRGVLFLAKHDGQLKGGVLIVRARERSWYILGATAKDDRLNVGHLLQWKAIQWAKAKGCREHDFGGFREDATAGPALFKRGFSDHVVHFISPHRYILNSGLYRTSKLVSDLRVSVSRSFKLLRSQKLSLLSHDPQQILGCVH